MDVFVGGKDEHDGRSDNGMQSGGKGMPPALKGSCPSVPAQQCSIRALRASVRSGHVRLYCTKGQTAATLTVAKVAIISIKKSVKNNGKKLKSLSTLRVIWQDGVALNFHVLL